MLWPGCFLSKISLCATPVLVSDGTILPSEGEIEHGSSVSLRCDQGYFVSGPETRRCNHGDWAGGGAEAPKCVGKPCALPFIPGGGRYLGNGGNYRPTQLVPHGTAIDFECDELKSTGSDGQPLRCERGRLLPENPGETIFALLLPPGTSFATR